MVTKAQKGQMLDYVVAQLEGSSEKVVPVTKSVIPGIDSNYILIGEKGVILMVDQIYSGGSFQDLYGKARAARPNVASVVLKDGRTFFRNAAEGKDFKRSNGLSLKHYSPQEMHRMILSRSEEIFLEGLNSGWVQYYQPDSERLRAGVEGFHFVPVELDYSHIDSREKFKPQNTISKRLHLWDKRLHFTEPLVLEGSLLKRRE